MTETGYSTPVRPGIIDGLREAVDNRTVVLTVTGPAFANVKVIPTVWAG
jgi:hypothetical protein